MWQIDLPISPSNLNCLSWSKNNLIAVAGGDQVAILSPRLREPGPNGTHWNSTLFRANAFTAEEVPFSEPLSSQNFSAGEELSLRYVQGLEWSSPGLARNGGCVLAVLSSNHVLSMWECDGRADLSANWKRRVTVNHALSRYYDTVEYKNHETEEETQECKQVCQRIRAFAFSPPVYKECGGLDEGPSPYLDHGYQFLAVSTEAEDIVFLRVLSPHDVLEPTRTEWDVEVVSCNNSGVIALEGLEASLTDEESEAYQDHSFIADHVAWGSWKYGHEFGNRANLVFIANNRLFCVKVEGSPYSNLPEAKVSSKRKSACLIPSHSDISGPLKLVPGSNLNVAFAPDRVFCVDSSATNSENGSGNFHHLDGRWDEISGAAFVVNGPSFPRIHIASVTSHADETTALELPLRGDEISSEPLWQTAITQSKSVFSAQQNLAGQVKERIWGIANSPLGEFVATAITVLPSDSVAYITPSDYRTIINITYEANLDEASILPANGGCSRPSDITSEVLLFSLQRYLERRPGVSDAEILVQAMLETIRPPGRDGFYDDDEILLLNRPEPAILIRYLRWRMLFRPETMRNRLKVLADVALGRNEAARHPSTSVVRPLVHDIARMPPYLEQGGSLSSKIRTIYSVLQSKLYPEEQASDGHRDPRDWSEECRICHLGIPFESVNWAKCGGGHQFSRCSLTFLAIQEPNVSKHCGICGRQYLNEWKLPEFSARKTHKSIEMTEGVSSNIQRRDEAAADEIGESEQPDSIESNTMNGAGNERSTIEPPTSLARILFAAFNVCVHCGGKLIA